MKYIWKYVLRRTFILHGSPVLSQPGEWKELFQGSQQCCTERLGEELQVGFMRPTEISGCLFSHLHRQQSADVEHCRTWRSAVGNVVMYEILSRPALLEANLDIVPCPLLFLQCSWKLKPSQTHCIVRKRWTRCFYIINLFPDPLWQAWLIHNFFSHRCHWQWCHPTLKTCVVITASLVASCSLASESCYSRGIRAQQNSQWCWAV